MLPFKINKFCLYVLLLLLVGCASVKPTPEQIAENERLAKTAKINTQLGIAYLERHDLQRAKQKLILALKQGPSLPEPWYAMAYFFESTGNKTQARQYYLKAIAVAPERGDAHNNYGTFLCRNGEYQAAIAQFVTATKDTNYLAPAAAYENAGLCARQIPQPTLALYYFDKALAQDAMRVNSLSNTIDIYLKMGAYQKVAPYLEKLDLLAATDPQTLKFHELLDKKQQEQQLAQKRVKIFATDLKQEHRFTEVAMLAKSTDPLLPYPPTKTKTTTVTLTQLKKVKTLPLKSVVHRQQSKPTHLGSNKELKKPIRHVSHLQVKSSQTIFDTKGKPIQKMLTLAASARKNKWN